MSTLRILKSQRGSNKGSSFCAISASYIMKGGDYMLNNIYTVTMVIVKWSVILFTIIAIWKGEGYERENE